MQWRHHAFRALCAGPLLALAGCYSYPYSSYSGQPGYYQQAPGTTLPPAGSYSMPGSSLPAPSSNPTYVPGGSSYPGGGGETWSPPTAPTPSSSNGGGSTSGNSNGGKFYEDDSRGAVPQPREPGGFGAVPRPFPYGAGQEMAASFNEVDGAHNGLTLASAESGTSIELESSQEDQFLVPIPLRSATFSVADDPSVADEDTPLNPYARDGEYRWLRGVLTYDERDKQWQIVYDEHPDETDAFDGIITLAPDPRLEKVINSDVVLVQGSIDPKHPDAQGKPSYLIRKLDRLTPK